MVLFIKSQPNRLKLFGAICCLCLLWRFSCLAGPVGNQPAEAGWAEVNITPPLGIGLGGRGGPETLAKRIIDPLHAQVVYLKDANGSGMVVVSFDLIGMSHALSERIRNAVVRELGVEYNLVVLNCSHTHSGPYMIRDLIAGVGPAPQIEIDYFDSLTEKIISATRAARKALAPAKVEVFEGASRVAINRRGKNKQGKRGIIPDPDGPIAEKVWVLKLSPLDGRPPAVIFSYACHPVIVYGYDFSAVSADFPGVTRNTLREKLGSQVHVQFIQGLAGDVRPRIMADLVKDNFRAPTPDDVKRVGQELADDVLTALNGKGKILDLDIEGTMDRPFLPRDKPPSRELYETMATNKTSPFRQSVARYWLERYDSGEGFARGDTCPVGLIRLAKNQWVCYTAGEPCVEWGPKMTAWLAPRHLVIWGYCQESLSYIPTEEMLPEGGYEVDDSNHARASTPARYGPGLNEAIRQSLLRQAAFIDAKVK